MSVQLQEECCWLGIVPSSSRPEPAVQPRQPPVELQGIKLGQPCGLSLAGPPRDDPVRLVSPCPPAGPAVGPGVSHTCSGRWIQAAPQMLHIKITSVMCFYFPPEEMSAPLLPSLPSLHQHIFVRLQPHFSFPQSILLCSHVPLFLMTDRANDGPAMVRDAHRPARRRCLARRCRDSGL